LLVVNPVAFPPGCLRLSTNPIVRASATRLNTIGIVLVACLVASAAAVPGVTITSGLHAISSSAKLERSDG
jgi:hypothetical protein